jgi:hypothetical protein
VTAELAGGETQRGAHVGDGQRVGEELHVEEGRVRDGRGEERRWRRRRRGDLGEKRLSARLEGDEAHPLLSRVVLPTKTKGPLLPSCVTTQD